MSSHIQGTKTIWVMILRWAEWSGCIKGGFRRSLNLANRFREIFTETAVVPNAGLAIPHHNSSKTSQEARLCKVRLSNLCSRATLSGTLWAGLFGDPQTTWKAVWIKLSTCTSSVAYRTLLTALLVLRSSTRYIQYTRTIWYIVFQRFSGDRLSNTTIRARSTWISGLGKEFVTVDF